MDGVWVQESTSKKSILFVVSSLSDELKALTRTNLSSICYGAARAARGTAPYSYKNTLGAFLERYESKSLKTKMGMMGELLAHVLLLQHKADMLPVTPFFNLEEKSIKKGFDIVLYHQVEKQMWITEVKASEGSGSTSSAKTRALLHRAKKDLHAHLSGGNSTRWHNAISGAYNAIQKKKVKDAVEEILERAFSKAEKKKLAADSINVVLVSVLFKDLQDSTSLQDVRDVRAEIKGEKLFRKVIAVSFQKNTFAKMEKFLKSELGK